MSNNTTNTNSQRVSKYIRENLHRMEIKYRNEEYESTIAPAILKSGKSMSVFVKEAIQEKIEREQLV